MWAATLAMVAPVTLTDGCVGGEVDFTGSSERATTTVGVSRLAEAEDGGVHAFRPGCRQRFGRLLQRLEPQGVRAAIVYVSRRRAPDRQRQ